jgi:2-C-methyl-D-erythritol 4-phosphate cytidylyltransferase
MGGIDKIFARIGGVPVLERVAAVFDSCPYVDHIIVVLSQENVSRGTELLERQHLSKLSKIIAGGTRRQDSVEAGLNSLPPCGWVIIHDGARPMVTGSLIVDGLKAAQESGAAIAAVPVTDTIKSSNDAYYVNITLDRSKLWSVQTPQVFRFDIIKEGYKNASGDVTDDAALVEALGCGVRLYMGAYDNIKLTTPADLALAEALWQQKEG